MPNDLALILSILTPAYWLHLMIVAENIKCVSTAWLLPGNGDIEIGSQYRTLITRVYRLNNSCLRYKG